MTTVLDRPSSPPVPITGKAAIYIRVSSHGQEDGASLDVQLESCRRYCETNGLLIVGEYQDVQSGLVVDRPRYQEVLRLARSGGFDKLVVFRYDRSGRDDAEFAGMLRDFAKLKIELVSASGESPDPLFQKLAGLLAWNESRTLSIRVAGSKMKRHEDGKWNGGPVFGYTLAKHDGGGVYLVPDEHQEVLVTELFAKFAAGQTTMIGLRNWLREHGVSKSRYSVYYILNNQVYLGRVPHGKSKPRSAFMPPAELQWTPGLHVAIVDQNTFDKVQARLQANRRNQRGGPNAKYLFTGLIYCGSCGAKYQARTFKRRGDKFYVDYRCQRRNGFGDCTGKSVLEGRIRAVVMPPIEALLRACSQEDVRQQIQEDIEQEQSERSKSDVTKVLTARLAKVETRLSNIEDAYFDEAISKDRYLSRRDEFTAQAVEIQAEIAGQPKITPVDLTQLFAIAERITKSITAGSMDDVTMRELVENMVDRVVIDGSTVNVFWKPEYQPVVAIATV